MLNLLVFLFLLVFKEKSTSLSHKTASQPKAAVYLRPLNGSVAQLDRASDYGSEGLGFESLRVHPQKPSFQMAFFMLLFKKFAILDFHDSTLFRFQSTLISEPSAMITDSGV